MMLVPWRRAKRWSCDRCGVCCYDYVVPLRVNEALRISRFYGDAVTWTDGKLYLRRIGGRCIFLRGYPPLTSCIIHLDKPKCCKLWPFCFYSEPRFGLSGQDAIYVHNDRRLYVYVNDECPRTGLGEEMEFLIEKIIRLVSAPCDFEPMKKLEDSTSADISPTLAPHIRPHRT